MMETERDVRRRLYGAKQAQMVCDHFFSMHERCKWTPTRAPRLVVPSTKGLMSGKGHAALKMFTTMHFCEMHKGNLKVADLLVARVKEDFETTAKRKIAAGLRDSDFKPDFEHAFIEWVLTSTPEYRTFLAAMGAEGQLRAALGVTRLAG